MGLTVPSTCTGQESVQERCGGQKEGIAMVIAEAATVVVVVAIIQG